MAAVFSRDPGWSMKQNKRNRKSNYHRKESAAMICSRARHFKRLSLIRHDYFNFKFDTCRIWELINFTQYFHLFDITLSCVYVQLDLMDTFKSTAWPLLRRRSINLILRRNIDFLKWLFVVGDLTRLRLNDELNWDNTFANTHNSHFTFQIKKRLHRWRTDKHLHDQHQR